MVNEHELCKGTTLSSKTLFRDAHIAMRSIYTRDLVGGGPASEVVILSAPEVVVLSAPDVVSLSEYLWEHKLPPLTESMADLHWQFQ